VDINDSNAKLEIKPNKFKVINISRHKSFQEETDKHLSKVIFQGDKCLFEDTPINSPQRPITRALKKLVDYKNAAAISVSIITNKLQEECDGNMVAENYNKYHCANCYNV
jgi:hypothetical protein